MNKYEVVEVKQSSNLRSKPSTKSKIVDQLQRGDLLSVRDSQEGWLSVYVLHTKTGDGIGEAGWISEDLVTSIAPPPPPAPVPPLPPIHPVSWVGIAAAIVTGAVAVAALVWSYFLP